MMLKLLRQDWPKQTLAAAFEELQLSPETRAEEVSLPQRRSRRPEVEALTGQRRVPVLVIDGEAICDSRRIVEYLEHRRSTAADPPPT